MPRWGDATQQIYHCPSSVASKQQPPAAWPLWRSVSRPRLRRAGIEQSSPPSPPETESSRLPRCRTPPGCVWACRGGVPGLPLASAHALVSVRGAPVPVAAPLCLPAVAVALPVLPCPAIPTCKGTWDAPGSSWTPLARGKHGLATLHGVRGIGRFPTARRLSRSAILLSWACLISLGWPF